MNILTFDIEDWYCHDIITGDLNWSRHETRIYTDVDRILDFLDEQNLKGTFMCLGWIAEHHPSIIKKISDKGHQIGCHSYQHELATNLNEKEFKDNLVKAKDCIENVIGKAINTFRAPAFSVTTSNLYVLDIICELGFKYDCSIFPAKRLYGGMPESGCSQPSFIKHNGYLIKEFPVNPHVFLGNHIIFSGGGYFRLLPYWIIKLFTTKSNYVMGYFHPSDFDPNQPKMKYLPIYQQWKNSVGLKSSFNKFKKYLSDFEFINIEQADIKIDWNKAKTIIL
ncbi:MAG: polysaccharide deacetylase family protein [Muribaculaceae bacterium]|jgi:polysaccharide deacetylase family protein (PEP-CTERM system associated)|nr:polysaccharide deacetylase family protein [Muribaculaceae bacterium]